MAITTQDEANAVQLLLDYYLRGTAEVPSHAQAQDAWMQLAESAREQLGLGWRIPDVGNLFMPRGEDGPEPNRDIPDDCEACLDVNGDCRFHRGTAFGSEVTLDSAANALRVFAHDPEQIGAVLDQDERNRQAEEEQEKQRQRSERQVRYARRVVTDWWLGDETSTGAKYQNEDDAADAEPEDPTALRPLVPAECPSCGHPERRFDPNTQVFSCGGGCLYTSSERNR